MRRTQKEKLRRAWPWVLGMMIGIGGGLLHLGAESAAARGDDAVVYEIDLSHPLNQVEIDELARFALEHEGSDVILRPSAGFEILSGEERRRQDEERAAREEEEMGAALAAATAEGLYVTGEEERSPCAVSSQRVVGEPARHLLCEGGLATAPARLPFERALGAGAVESTLEAYVRDLLEGTLAEEEAAGYGSSFSDSTALTSLTVLDGGLVELELNSGIEAQVGSLHTGYATHNMLQQIYRTLFQFRDVSAVEIRLEGSCEAFGKLIGGPCQKLDRETWELMNSENGERVEFFTLAGGK